MDLSTVHIGVHKNKRRKRLGRGPGSKTGRTAGKGNKGQYARSGDNPGLLYEGGQMPLFMRLPKRGFNNAIFRTHYDEINVCDLDQFEDGAVITPKVIDKSGLHKLRHGKLKVLGNGELSTRLEVHADKFSASAKEKIEKAGGKCVVIQSRHRGPKVKNKMRPRKSADGSSGRS